MSPIQKKQLPGSDSYTEGEIKKGHQKATGGLPTPEKLPKT